MSEHQAQSGALDAATWLALRERLARSRFRSRFQLNERDATYAANRGMPILREHARDFVHQRLAPATPKNDGRQTPMRGHPAFVAQHATATCCRGCLRKWHGIPAGRALTDREIRYTVDVIVAWLGEPPAANPAE
jgi:hypothetical protein